MIGTPNTERAVLEVPIHEFFAPPGDFYFIKMLAKKNGLPRRAAPSSQ